MAFDKAKVISKNSALLPISTFLKSTMYTDLSPYSTLVMGNMLESSTPLSTQDIQTTTIEDCDVASSRVGAESRKGKLTSAVWYYVPIVEENGSVRANDSISRSDSVSAVQLQ